MTPPYQPEHGDDDDDHPCDERHVPATTPNSWVRKTRGLVLKTWDPRPLPPPRVDSGLASFNAVERSAEVLRYMCQRSEYWISPGGLLREWLRFNVRIAVLLLVPALLVVPLVTHALRQFSTWTDLVTTTTSKMILFPLSALLVVGLISGLVYLGKAFQQRPRQRQGYYE